MHNEIKETYRRKYHQLRSETLRTVEEKILKQVKNSLQKRIALGKLQGFIGLYWPLAGEVDLRELRQCFELPLALPASNKDGNISYHPWSKRPLFKDSCGIPAPLKDPPLKATDLSLLLVPALAIDAYGYRLGYGGGFFDRLRSEYSWRSISCLVVLPKICVLNKPLPHEKWDIPFDGWINENGEQLAQKI